MRKIFLLAALILLAGCSATQNVSRRVVSDSDYYNEAYRGRTHAQIVKEYGAPDREASDGEDGYILIYEDFYTTSHVDHMGFVDHNTHKSYIQFFMTDRGICYNVKTNKLAPGVAESAFAAVTIGSGIFAGLNLLAFTTLFLSANRWGVEALNYLR